MLLSDYLSLGVVLVSLTVSLAPVVFGVHQLQRLRREYKDEVNRRAQPPRRK